MAAQSPKSCPPKKPHWLTTFWREHLRHWLGDYRLIVIGTFWAIALALGYIGFAQYAAFNNEQKSPFDLLYLSLQLFTFESGSVHGPGIPLTLEIARYLAPIVAAYTALRALAVIFSEQFRQVRIQRVSNHIVICGLGRKGYLLARSFRDQGDQVVVIERNENNDRLQQCRELGAIVLIGNAISFERLQRARVHKARAIIAVCGEDGTNAEIGARTRELMQFYGSRDGGDLKCLIHIVDPRLCKLLRERMSGADDRVEGFSLGFFNVFEDAARLVLQRHSPLTLPKNGQNRSHLLVIGLGRMGENIVTQAARAWQSEYRQNGEKLHITIIDREAHRKIAFLNVEYPGLEDICEMYPLQMNVRDAEFEEAHFLYQPDGNPETSNPMKELAVSIIYVCMDDDSLNLSAALTLHQRLQGHRIPIVIRMQRSTGLAQLLEQRDEQDDTFKNLHAFGLLDQTCTPDILSANGG